MTSRSGGRSSIALMQVWPPPCARRAAAPRQARRIGLAGAGDVEGRAVIRRGADERQSQRDVDGVLEGDRLDRDQRLVVIHADRAVIGLARRGVEHGVGRQRSPDVDAFAAQRFDRRRDDFDVLGAERAVFAGMRIEAGYRKPRMGEAETGSSRSATAMRAVATISSLDSCAIASRSERWMVTGTTASAGDHSIITGCGARPPSAASSARNSVWPGWRNPAR